MSFYNNLFGVNPASGLLLKALNLNVSDIPRFRDCYLDGDKIVVHTRTGGGNREDYEEENERLAQHPNYSYDEDNDFDSTYADFYFTFPEEYKSDLEALSKELEGYSPSDNWQKLFAAFEAAKSDKAA